MVSELLEQSGIGRAQLEKAHRQVLEGVVLFCQWQLQRMEAKEPPRPAGRKAHKVVIE
jgi:hypothetical protein